MSDYSASSNDPTSVKDIADAFGFCLVKGVFSATEMADLERDLAMAHAEFAGALPDIYSTPSLQWLLFDQRLRALAHALLGSRLVYYRETASNYEETPGQITAAPFTEYHCDARGNHACLAGPPEDRGVFPAYRFGIYFRDYRRYSGGLKVAPGSHLRDFAYDYQWNAQRNIAKLPKVKQVVGPYELAVPAQPMELYNVPSEPGDIVIFNLRCYHSAGAVRLKGRPTLALLPSVESRLPPEVRLPIPPGSRNTIFFDYGAPTKALDYYVKRCAVANPAIHDVTYKYHAAPPDWMLIRNDKIIVRLAHRLVDSGSQTSGERDAADLVTLCRSHVEFGPAHALFDRAAFKANLACHSPATAMDLARDIVARVTRHRAEAKLQSGQDSRVPFPEDSPTTTS